MAITNQRFAIEVVILIGSVVHVVRVETFVKITLYCIGVDTFTCVTNKN